METVEVQGGVQSPALFDYYLDEFPAPPLNIKLMKNTNDITIFAPRPVVVDKINGLNIYLSKVLNYIKKDTDSVNDQIYSISDTHEQYLHQQVKLADQVLPLERKPKVLVVTLDTHLTFTQHCNNIAVKVQQNSKMLKALAGSTCGCNKEALLTTYQAIVRTILSHCCAVWTPPLKDTNLSRLELAQNSQLRISMS